jgi:AraC-like DNA-binding protein
MSKLMKINHLSEVLRFMEMPAPKHPLVAYIDFSKTPFNQAIPLSKVICNFYQISLKGDECGSLSYGRQNYDYQEGSLVYVGPEQVIEYGVEEEKSINQGKSLFFHPDFIRTSPLVKKMKEYSFFGYHANEALHISEKEREIIESIFSKIETELDSNLDDFSEDVLITNIELLLNYSKRFYNRQFITRKRFSNDIISNFEHLLNDYFIQGLQKESGIPTVQYFADKLNFSSNYISDLIRKGTDKSILEHIHYHVIELAKTQLLNSTNTVSEIAFDLGFEYSQYFSRLFKNKVGKTPMQYRSLN